MDAAVAVNERTGPPLKRRLERLRRRAGWDGTIVVETIGADKGLIQSKQSLRGSVMKGSDVDGASQVGRCLNAVSLQNAVLCAECDVVSDSPHDRCLVCGSPSLFNISRMLGGTLPRVRATLIGPAIVAPARPELVLSFSRTHRLRRKVPA